MTAAAIDYSDLGVRNLRRLRLQVRGLINLTGAGRKIGEHPGVAWRANMVTRQVEWTPLFPLARPGEQPRVLDYDSIVYLTAHESSHLKWSGTYDTNIPPRLQARFHRFVNALEDVRVDRLSAKQYRNFRAAKLHVDGMIRAWHLQHSRPDEWSLDGQVGMNAIYSLDLGLPPFGSPEAIATVERLWPRLTRLANTRSTQELVDGLEPIFLELVQRDEEIKNPAPDESGESGESGEPGESSGSEQGDDADDQADDGAGDADDDEQEAEQEQGSDGAGDGDGSEEQGEDEGAGEDADAGADESDAAEDAGDGGADGDTDEGDGESAADGADGEQESGQGADAGDDTQGGGDLPGADQPTDAPVKSEGKDGTEPLPFGGELAGLAEDAHTDEAREALEDMGVRPDVESQARNLAELQTGLPESPDTHTGRARWDTSRDVVKGSVNVLGQRLLAKLRHNAMDNPVGNQRRGKLDVARAYKADTGSLRIFKRPGTVGGHDYTFGLLIDSSTSMGRQVLGPRGSLSGRFYEIDHARDACVLMAEALEKAGLGVFVIVWNSGINHVKPVDQPLSRHRGRLGEALHASGGTREAPALVRAQEEFSKVPGKKVLITVTDGEASDAVEAMLAIRDLVHDGVHPLTIRVGAGRPAAYYPERHLVAHANELRELLPRIINTVVRKGE